MLVISSPLELKNRRKSYGLKVGFVPTMGALHQGHISLIKKAKEENEFVVVSIFVNPTQFLPGEDLNKYPRKLESDLFLCKSAGVDIVFTPNISDMYQYFEPKVIANDIKGFILEGASRPEHFDGVLTIVLKLLNIVSPTNAYFGKKDAQQLILIQNMVNSFYLDTNIIFCDTVREKDGLALSSRNVYLDELERLNALKISSALRSASLIIAKGERDSLLIKNKVLNLLEDLEVVYVEIIDRDLNFLEKIDIGNTVIVVAVKLGTTRLIDNIWI